MEVQKVVKPVYVLELSEDEHNWLRGYLQNAQCPPEHEHELDFQMRKTFFDTMNSNRSNKNT
jgi:hypothetical protein